MFEESSRSSMLSISLNKLASCALITVVLLSATVSINSEISTDNKDQLLEVQVYYETLCPDSKRFIRYQFYNSMIEKKLLKYTDLKLIPYGKVSIWTDPVTNKKYLNCQHGSRECDLNALHACIVENNNELEQMMMIDCLMGGYTVQNCADTLNVNVTAALNCKSTRSVEDILKKYGEETNAIDLWFVPSIALDGQFEHQAQNGLLENFKKAFCTKYIEKYSATPEGC